LQTAQFQRKSQSLKESIFYPNHRQIKKNLPLLKKSKLNRLTKKRQTDNEKEALGGNRRLAQWRVKRLIDHSTSQIPAPLLLVY
jgi:hypothetical protein